MDFVITYPYLLRGAYVAVLIPSIIVFITAVLSAKAMGGTLGLGLKKISTGSITHTILLMTYILLEHGNRGVLDENAVRWFFLSTGLLGSLFLISGYLDIYRIARKLKLFTP